VQRRWADVHGDRAHAAIAEGELTDAGVIAAELGAEAVGRIVATSGIATV
jgi:hypothetical protein